ncbi:MAG: hypothetical protein GY801_15595 [bacterium]|nr:hypothetical protein [bacterium]
MKSVQDLIEEKLLRLCRQGKFEALLLFNNEGIPMAEAGECVHYSKDTLTALSVVFHQAVEVFEDFEFDAPLNENSFRSSNKFRIVCRPIRIDELKLILIAILPHQSAYRKMTNEAIKHIRLIMG